MMEEGSGYIILDVRTPEEFAEKHIPGAINVANETIGTDEIPELPDEGSGRFLDSFHLGDDITEKPLCSGYNDAIKKNKEG